MTTRQQEEATRLTRQWMHWNLGDQHRSGNAMNVALGAIGPLPRFRGGYIAHYQRDCEGLPWVAIAERSKTRKHDGFGVTRNGVLEGIGQTPLSGEHYYDNSSDDRAQIRAIGGLPEALVIAPFSRVHAIYIRDWPRGRLNGIQKGEYPSRYPGHLAKSILWHHEALTSLYGIMDAFGIARSDKFAQGTGRLLIKLAYQHRVKI